MLKLIKSQCRYLSVVSARGTVQMNGKFIKYSTASTSSPPQGELTCRNVNARNEPVDTGDNPSSTNLEHLVHHLERTSLVDFDSKEAIDRLNEAINFANQLMEVNTDGVEPLVTVLENESLFLRDDIPEPTKREDILRNATVTEEDYFVAPPGNIPLEPSSKSYLKDESKNT